MSTISEGTDFTINTVFLVAFFTARSRKHFKLAYTMKRLALFITFTTLLATGAEATFTRSEGMALDQRFSYMVSDQFAYIFENPAFVNDYQNQFYFEHRNKTGTDENLGGMFLKPFRNFTFGFVNGLTVNKDVFNSTTSPRGMFFEGTLTNPNDKLVNNGTVVDLNNAIINAGNLSLTQTINIFQNTRNQFEQQNLLAFAGYKLRRIKLGALFGYGFVEDVEIKKEKIEESVSLRKTETSIGLGAHFDIGYKWFKSADVAASHRFYQMNNEYDEVSSENFYIRAALKSKGAGDSRLSGRLNVQIHSKHTLHFYYAYSRLNSSTEAQAISTVNLAPSTPFNLQDTFTRKGSNHTFGISDEIYPIKPVMVFIALHLELESLNNSYDGSNNLAGTFRQNPAEETYSYTYLPLTLGLEGQITDFLTIRFGLSHSLKNRLDGTYDQELVNQQRANIGSTEITNSRTTTVAGAKGPDSTVSLGLTIKYRRFSFDFIGNADFFREGPNFISGQSNDLSTGIALSYYFGEESLFTGE